MTSPLAYNDPVRKQEREAAQAQAFSAFLARPTTKLAVSMVPANEQHPETLRCLLETAFAAGAEYGQGAMAGDFMQAMLAGILKDKRREDE